MRVPIDPLSMPPDLIGRLYGDRHEAEEAVLVRRALRAHDRVLEIGAGIGMIGALCARIVGSDRVLSYEANPALEPMIRRTHAANDVAPTLRMRAVAVQAGEIGFFVCENIVSSSLIDRRGGALRMTPCDALDAVIAEFGPTVIVADIEGAEVELFARADLSGVERMIVELHPAIVGRDRIEALLEALAARGLAFVSGDRGKVALLARRPSDGV